MSDVNGTGETERLIRELLAEVDIGNLGDLLEDVARFVSRDWTQSIGEDMLGVSLDSFLKMALDATGVTKTPTTETYKETATELLRESDWLVPIVATRLHEPAGNMMRAAYTGVEGIDPDHAQSIADVFVLAVKVLRLAGPLLARLKTE